MTTTDDLIVVYLPDSAPGPDPITLAPSPASLAGLRIAVLDNGKPNAVEVMTRAAETLAARTGATVSLVTKKGPRRTSANAAIPSPTTSSNGCIAEADMVITGAADCGSCTAYSVYDTIELERPASPPSWSPRPSSSRSRSRCSASFGLPDTRRLVLPHPIGGTDEATLHEWADAAADTLIQLFTTGGQRP